MEKQDGFSEFQSPDSASVDRLVQALDKAYHRPGLLAWRSFLGGLMYAFGATIGFTLLLTIAIYLLQVFGGHTLFTQISDSFQNMIASVVNKTTAQQTTSLSPAQQAALDQILLHSSPTPSPTISR